MALQLKKAGVRKVHPLEGGFEAWLELGLPTEPVSVAENVRLHAHSDNGRGAEAGPGNAVGSGTGHHHHSEG